MKQPDKKPSATAGKIVYLALPLVSKITLLIIIGGIFFAFAGASQKSMVDDEFKKDWGTFVSAYDTLERFAPPELTQKEIIYGGIRGMLQTLDPHSHFLDSDAFAYMQEEQEGSFFGIGISFDISPDGYLRVVAPIEGTPAYELGIKAGDRIIKINGESTKDITEIEVIRKLRGKKGTSVDITVEREGADGLLDVTIVRDRIPLMTVREPYMIRPGVGYLKITQFSRPTYKEFMEGLEKLEKNGLKKLLIDLRNNPGGLLDQAVALSDIFVEKGNNIVITDGRVANSHIEFKAQMKEYFRSVPIVVLVNSASASASEIVAGALQDLDRALVVGTRTYGKGLVQRQYPLPQETAIQITTAKYYTPSERCIQRSYHTPHEQYFRKINADLKAQSEDQVFYSRGGRKLLGGGGIVPDITIEQKIPEIILQLASREMFFNFAIQNQQAISFNSPDKAAVSDELFQKFKTFATSEKIDFKEDVWNKEKEIIKLWLKQEFVSARFGLDEKLKVANEHDFQLMEALKMFDKAENLLSTYHGS